MNSIPDLPPKYNLIYSALPKPKTNACGKIILCSIKCTSCPTCNQTCKDFEKQRCSRLDKAP